MFETILFRNCLGLVGASDGTQTRGLFLGKEALYQLSYTRRCGLPVRPKMGGDGGASQTRTGDTRLFRPLLYQLS